MAIGPPRVGKTCLYKAGLLGETPPGEPSTKTEASNDSKSTDVIEERKMIQVKMKPSTMIVTELESGEWKEVNSLDDEIAIFVKSVHSQCLPNNTSSSTGVEPASIEDSKSDDPSASSVPGVISAPSVPESSDTELDRVSMIAEVVNSKNVNLSKLQTLLENSVTIFYTDTGGQPEFQEVLPALVAGPTIFLLIFSLYKGLDSKYEVRYEPSSLDEYAPYDSSFTVRQVLMECLASIASFYNAQSLDCLESVHHAATDQKLEPPPDTNEISKPPPPVKTITIATHKDLVDSDTVIDEIDNALQKSVADTDLEHKDIIEPFSDETMLIPVNNYAPGDGKKVRQVIERVIKRQKEAFRITIPVPWLGVEIALRQHGSSTISYDECLKIAKKFNVSRTDLPRCLWFLHYKAGSIRYYGEKVEMLKNIVIIKPAIIFDSITELITSTFIHKDAGPKMKKNFRTLGLFKADEIREIFGKHQSKLELLSCDQLLALLQHLNILSKAFDDEFNFMLPSALVHADLSSISDLIATDNVIFILFKGGVVPKGVFSGLLAVLVENNSKISRDHDRKPLLFRNQATFSIDSLDCSVTLTKEHKYISVGVRQFDQSDAFCHFKILKVLEASVANAMQTLRYAINIVTFGVYCTESRCIHKEPHPAEVHVDRLKSKAKCINTKNGYYLKDPKDRAWFTPTDNPGMMITVIIT